MPADGPGRLQADRGSRTGALGSAFPARHDRAKITDWVFAELKSAIIDLRLAPGEPLREAMLAESLGVSKTPIREALTRLEQEGLVESASFKGAVVSGYTRRDLIELYELQELLETWAVQKASTAASDEELASLEALIAESRQFAAKGPSDGLEQVIDDFDTFLYAQVTNSRIAVLIDNLGAHLTRIGRLTAGIPGRLAKSVDEHAHIVDALLRRDPETAVAALQSHIASVRNDQLRAFDETAEHSEVNGRNVLAFGS